MTNAEKREADYQAMRRYLKQNPEAFELLTDKQAIYMEMRYLRQMTLTDIGNKAGVSPATVLKVIRNGCRTLEKLQVLP